VLERRQSRARREHPAAEEALLCLARPRLVDLDKGGVLRPLLGRAAPAIAHDNRQIAESHRRADCRIELRHPRRRLVEPLQLRQRLGDHVRRAGARHRAGRQHYSGQRAAKLHER